MRAALTNGSLSMLCGSFGAPSLCLLWGFLERRSQGSSGGGADDPSVFADPSARSRSLCLPRALVLSSSTSATGPHAPRPSPEAPSSSSDPRITTNDLPSPARTVSIDPVRSSDARVQEDVRPLTVHVPATRRTSKL